MDEAEGNLLSTLIMEQRGDTESFIERSAKWLAKLHNVPDSFPCSDGRKITKANSNSLAGIYNKHRVDEEKQEILTSIKYSKSLLTIFPKLAGKIEGISKDLIAMQRKHCPQSNITPNGVGKLSLIHGDYHSKNICVSDNCITVVDLEESRVGDPAFDLGYFIAQLKMSFGFSTTMIRWADLFIRKYLEESRFLMQNPSSDDEATLARRMKIYEAQTYFQRSYHTYYLLGLTPDTELVSRWLEESRLVLEVAKEVHN
jgi:hypothetical protein